MTASRILTVAAGLAGLIALAAPALAQPLNVGVIGTSSDAPFFIADKKGYFKEAGLTINFIRFDSAAKMIAPLGAGQLDTGGGATSAGLYNAVSQGVLIKIVTDKARNSAGYGFQALLVRKDLADKVKDYKDLKGLKIATSAVGNSESSLLNEALKKGGLKLSDVDQVYIGFPQHPAAYANGGIDASITTEPTISTILKAGSAVRKFGVDEFFPNHQTAVTFYGEEFVKKNPEGAKKFMVALMRGIRFYNDALEAGRIAGPNAEEVIAIMTEYSVIKDPAIYRAIISHAVDPNGEVDMPSLRKDWEFFRDTDQLEGKVTVDQVVDLSFAKQAVAALGPYKRAGKP